ncbi:MAG: prepilin-type N-terminal cleavage/methylation domain-containing protein [Thermodesulfobacteriota bacterium]|nr:prepilin-type N-terminal cleavage/methylation domain-containing protein [Thermodesulfobacteriota bacterium]
MKQQRKKRNKGFSLVELMIALAVGAVLTVGVFNFFASMEKSYTVQDQMTVMQQNARVGIDFMTKEIRLAGYGMNAGEIITVADDDSITFRGDVDSDGNVETVQYTVDTGTLELTRDVDGSGAEPVAENIPSTGLVFTYFDDSGSDLSTSDPLPLSSASRRSIRRINISLTVRTDRADADYGANGGFRTITFTANARPRNIGLTNLGCSLPGTPTIDDVATTGLNSTYPCQLYVEWSAVTTDAGGSSLGTDCELTTYKVYYGTTTSPETYATPVLIPKDNTNATFSVPPDCTYYVTLSAENSAGEGNYTTEVTINDSTGPGTPTGLAATPFDNRIDLEWDAPTSNNCDIAIYNIYRAVSAPVTWNLIDTTDHMETTYQDSPISNCTQYFYRVTAVDQCGFESVASTWVTATTGSSPPRKPADVIVINGATWNDVTWTAPPNNVDGTDFIYSDPDHYDVFRGPSQTGPWTLIHTYVTSTSFVDFSGGSSDWYMVRAVDVCGNESADSDAAAALSLAVSFEPGYPYKSSGQRKIRVEVSVVNQYSMPVTDATVTVTVQASGYTDETDTLVHNGDGVYGCGSHPKWYWEGTTGYSGTDTVTVTVTASKDGFTPGTVSDTFQ